MKKNNIEDELIIEDDEVVFDKKSKKKNKKKMSKKKKVLIISGSSVGGLFLIILFLLYGPWGGFRNLWITTAMTTMNHRYLATMLYSDETIQKVLEANSIIEPKGVTNTDLIKFVKYGKSTVYKNEYDEQVLKHDKNALYKVIDIKGKGYNGYLVAIYDPSRISIATSKYLGKRGEDILTVAKDNLSLIHI